MYSEDNLLDEYLLEKWDIIEISLKYIMQHDIR